MSALLQARIYSVLLAASTLFWWGTIWVWPRITPHFIGPELPAAALYMFLAPDLVAFVAVPMAYALTQKRIYLDFAAHAAGYATLLTLSLCCYSKGGWLGLGLMSLATAAAWHVRRGVICDEAA